MDRRRLHKPCDGEEKIMNTFNENAVKNLLTGNKFKGRKFVIPVNKFLAIINGEERKTGSKATDISCFRTWLFDDPGYSSTSDCGEDVVENASSAQLVDHLLRWLGQEYGYDDITILLTVGNVKYSLVTDVPKGLRVTREDENGKVELDLNL